MGGGHDYQRPCRADNGVQTGWAEADAKHCAQHIEQEYTAEAYDNAGQCMARNPLFQNGSGGNFGAKQEYIVCLRGFSGFLNL